MLEPPGLARRARRISDETYQMSLSRSDPRILVVVAAGEFRDELATLLADLGPVFIPSEQPGLLDFLTETPTLQVVVIVECGGETMALDLLNAAKRRRAQLAVFVLSDKPTIDHATEAIRRGAEDFVPIPLSGDLLRKEIDRALETADLRDNIAHLRSLVSTAYGFDQIVSNSPRMRPVFERALAASRSDTPVLIIGETGTGKELLARAIHANSRRRDRPFVPVNCAALPRDLIESELFGHRRGAFSGAHADHQGLFVTAHRGTMLLDEVGELPAEAQAKFLRVLQDGEVRPVGGLDSRRIDVRVIAATNRSLADLRAGSLRQDLFFRLSVLVIEVPPLRERVDDILRLVHHFLARYSDRDAPRLSGLTPDALDVLTRYSYPGNVRELENLVHSLCTTLPPDRTEIQAADVLGCLQRQGASPPPAAPEPPKDLTLNLRGLETWALKLALERTGGNKSRAAQLLGISRDSLYRKLHELELSDITTGNITSHKIKS
ncbi:MAG: sigma-54-dependent Fis family transcriptional regulator [Acidobacteriota bacterium]|nr:sigma-54-dependent Fis family transcriptional regulator [Acidobacteriota bacterium]